MKLKGTRALIHPLDRWNPRAMAVLNELGLPVQESEFMPRGKIYALDETQIEEWRDSLDFEGVKGRLW